MTEEQLAIRRAALEQARDVEPVGGDYIDAGGWYVGYAHGVKAKTDAIAALIEGDAAPESKEAAMIINDLPSQTAELEVSKSADGYVKAELTFEGRSFYVEVGATRYSGYLCDRGKSTYFQGENDAAE
jgi:hypothetical protein